MDETLPTMGGRTGEELPDACLAGSAAVSARHRALSELREARLSGRSKKEADDREILQKAMKFIRNY